MKFGKAQQIGIFEENGLPLFEGNPAEPEKKSVWVSSPWDKWINQDGQDQEPEQSQPKQSSLF